MPQARKPPAFEVPDVHEAAVEWVSLAIQRADPDEAQPRQLAEQLIGVIDEEDVPVEELVRWIEEQEGEISTRECAAWWKDKEERT